MSAHTTLAIEASGAGGPAAVLLRTGRYRTALRLVLGMNGWSLHGSPTPA